MPNHQRLIKEATLFQVLDQSGEWLITGEGKFGQGFLYLGGRMRIPIESGPSRHWIVHYGDTDCIAAPVAASRLVQS